MNYRLEVEPLDLGPDVRAIGLELVEAATGEPAAGPDAARIWAAVLVALAGEGPWTLDFFAHPARLREFCDTRGLPYRIVGPATFLAAPEGEALAAVVERFAAETFGARAGTPLAEGDAALEGELARRGLDSYHRSYEPYLFCALCEPATGWMTLLTRQLSSSEVLRRLRPALRDFAVEITLP